MHLCCDFLEWKSELTQNSTNCQICQTQVRLKRLMCDAVQVCGIESPRPINPLKTLFFNHPRRTTITIIHPEASYILECCCGPVVGAEKTKRGAGEATSGSHQTLKNRRPSHMNNFMMQWVVNRLLMPITRACDFGSSV